MTSDAHANHAPADALEVAHFDAIAHRFWDAQGDFKPLHALNPPRTEFVVSRAGIGHGVGHRDGDGAARLLDVGCGGGLLAESLTRAGARVTAIDLAPSMIEVARLHALESGLMIDYRVMASGELLAQSPATFDAVTCMEMLEHVPEPKRTLAELAALARPGGHVFVSTINRTARAFLIAILGAEYLAQLLPRGTHEFGRLIRPSELARWGRAAGLELREIAGLDYNPVSSQACLSADPGVNYVAWFSRPSHRD